MQPTTHSNTHDTRTENVNTSTHRPPESLLADVQYIQPPPGHRRQKDDRRGAGQQQQQQQQQQQLSSLVTIIIIIATAAVFVVDIKRKLIL